MHLLLFVAARFPVVFDVGLRDDRCIRLSCVNKTKADRLFCHFGVLEFNRPHLESLILALGEEPGLADNVTIILH